jgi:heme a synthase
VLMNNSSIGIFHGCLAQSFFLLTCFIAVATSPWWKTTNLAHDPAKKFTKFALFLTLLIFVNMAVAATMRHAHAGLSIPDFPSAYGKVFPPLDAASLDQINTARIAKNMPETSATLISLQYIHRLIAYFLGIAIPWLSYRMYRAGGVLKKCAIVWPILVFVQIILGAWTIWSNKAADIATAHVAVGACIFILSGLITIIGARAQSDAAKTARAPRKRVESPSELAEVAA